MFPTRLLFLVVPRPSSALLSLSREVHFPSAISRRERKRRRHRTSITFPNSSAGNRRSRLSYRAKWDRISRGSFVDWKRRIPAFFLKNGSRNFTWIWNSLGIPTSRCCLLFGSNRRRSCGLEKGAIVFAANAWKSLAGISATNFSAVRGGFQLSKNDKAFNLPSIRLQGHKLITRLFLSYLSLNSI